MSPVLIGLSGREEAEKPISVFSRGADDLVSFLESKCQGQADWVATGREMGYVSARTHLMYHH